jgi:hypothetical protein
MTDKLTSDRLIKDNKISQFIQALAFFELELQEMTGQPGYEDRNKVIAIRKKGNPRILCAYSTYDELLDWAKQQFND